VQCANARLSRLVFLRSHCHIDMAYNALEYIFAALLDAPLYGQPKRRQPRIDSKRGSMAAQ